MNPASLHMKNPRPHTSIYMGADLVDLLTYLQMVQSGFENQILTCRIVNVMLDREFGPCLKTPISSHAFSAQDICIKECLLG